MTDKTVSVPTESRQSAHEFLFDYMQRNTFRANGGHVTSDHQRDLVKFAEAYAASSSLLTVGSQHNWKCVAPENGYYRWQCQNPGCSETAPYPSEKSPNSLCMGSGCQLENGPNHDVGGAFLREIRPEPDSPSCHVCGSLTIPTEWKCVCCGTTTKPVASLPVGESTPSNEVVLKLADFPRKFREIAREFANEGWCDLSMETHAYADMLQAAIENELGLGESHVCQKCK